MSNFLTRIISAFVYAALFIFCIMYSKESYIILISIFGCISLWEFSKIINTREVLLFVPLLFGTVYLKYIGKLPVHTDVAILSISILCLLYLIINLYNQKITPRTLTNRLFLTLSYIIIPFVFLAFIPFTNNDYTPQLIVFIICIIWTNDSFAYLVGKNFGKRKLFERISPKKTIEGFIGGLFFSLLMGLFIGMYTNILHLSNWIIIALIVSVFGTYGDLVESKFKRLANVKDSGTIMPGHGGLLDRLDSLFFLAPFVYLYIHFCI